MQKTTKIHEYKPNVHTPQLIYMGVSFRCLFAMIWDSQCNMHACLRPLLNKSTVETVVKQPLLGNGRINTQQWAAHATIEES
jgi:hypothetical protein